MLEKTLTIIKPEHIKLANVIFEELDHYGTRLITANVPAIPKEIIEAHYAHHKNKPAFKRITSSFIGKPVIVSIYEGENIIQKFIDIIGPTDPSKAPRHTIRGKYSDDSLEKAEAEDRTIYNVIHRSESQEEALREIEVWRQYLI